ncbi:MAG: hypothetical protein CMO26_16415 [Thiotrichales bacterium]|nr:hypothetical protein [Thiotrichales bacterium]
MMARLHDVSFDGDQVAAMVEAPDFDVSALDKPVRQHSKGMVQKLGLAACFLSGKDLFVLDEPTSGLDSKARILVKQHLQRLRDSGASILISTHMLADAEQVCDRIGVLHDGTLKFIGTPTQCCVEHGVEHLEEAYLTLID